MQLKNIATNYSRSASDNIRTITEKMESVYVQKLTAPCVPISFQKSLANEQEAVGAYFASAFIDK